MAKEQTRHPAIFISYMQKEREVADFLSRLLIEHGARVRLHDAESHLDELTRVYNSINDVVRNDLFVTLISPKYLRFEGVSQLLKACSTIDGRVIRNVVPVLVRPTDRISNIKWSNPILPESGEAIVGARSIKSQLQRVAKSIISLAFAQTDYLPWHYYSSLQLKEGSQNNIIIVDYNLHESPKLMHDRSAAMDLEPHLYDPAKVRVGRIINANWAKPQEEGSEKETDQSQIRVLFIDDRQAEHPVQIDPVWAAGFDKRKALPAASQAVADPSTNSTEFELSFDQSVPAHKVIAFLHRLSAEVEAKSGHPLQFASLSEDA